MKSKTINNIILGIFVLSGLLFLILFLYMIGRNKSYFGSNFIIKARFENVQGLKAGNNVRYAGIEIGTVKKINILNDTTLEVEMIIDDKLKPVLRKNAIVSIGTDGLVGNKVVNIIASKKTDQLVEEGDLLTSKKPIDTDDMIRTLHKTNNDVAIIAENLKTTVSKLNNSEGLWNLLKDPSIQSNLNQFTENLADASVKAKNTLADAEMIVSNIKNGKGVLHTIIYDTAMAGNLSTSVVKLKQSGYHADSLMTDLRRTVANLEKEINNGEGILHSILTDSINSIRLDNILKNTERGTDGFNQNMEALKHNFLFRGYFRKLEKQQSP